MSFLWSTFLSLGAIETEKCVCVSVWWASRSVTFANKGHFKHGCSHETHTHTRTHTLISSSPLFSESPHTILMWHRNSDQCIHHCGPRANDTHTYKYHFPQIPHSRCLETNRHKGEVWGCDEITVYRYFLDNTFILAECFLFNLTSLRTFNWSCFLFWKCFTRYPPDIRYSDILSES